MKSNQQIDVRISPEGAITIHAAGYTGTTCEEATRFLEETLGAAGHRQRTRDWYRRDTHATHNQNQNQNQQTQQT